MTATTAEPRPAGALTPGATGRVARVIGPVVDIEFPADAVPDMYSALTAELTLGDQRRTITFETAAHLGDNIVRAIALQATDGLVRGVPVQDTGGPISVPVGDVVKGHIFNVLGESLDVDSSELDIQERWGFTARLPISRSSKVRPRCWRPASRSSTCLPLTSRAERSDCSAVRVSARPSSSRR